MSERTLLSTRPTTLTPAEAGAAWQRGAVVVDLRTGDERRRQGVLPGALCLEAADLDTADLDQQLLDEPVVLVCTDGSRSRAVAERLGDSVRSVTAVAGGYADWSRQVWRAWGEFLMAEPGTPTVRFFRQLG